MANNTIKVSAKIATVRFVGQHVYKHAITFSVTKPAFKTGGNQNRDQNQHWRLTSLWPPPNGSISTISPAFFSPSI